MGSIEGDGYISLGNRTLTVGTTNQSTTFPGHIQDNYIGGSLIKTGSGTLTQIRVDRSTASNVTLNPASPSFSGTLRLTDGVTNFNASGCAGTGTIDIQPLFPVVLSRNRNTGNGPANVAIKLCKPSPWDGAGGFH